MLPASNRGAGMNLGFPDVCNTVVGPATVPIPYPNIAMNAQALGFSPIVKVSMVNALNMGSKIPMTSGDEAGAAHPTVKGAGAYTMGNPIVSIDKLPAITLTCPTTGNNMNNPVGAVLVPSAVNVLMCERVDASGADLQHVAAALDARSVTGFAMLGEGVGSIRVPHCGSDVAVAVLDAAFRLASAGARALVLDLRGNPGGDLDATVALARALLPDGAVVAHLEDADGDVRTPRATGPAQCALPLVLVVDQATASSAELLAAALQANRRAVVVGARTFGKGWAWRIVVSPEGVPTMTPSTRWTGPTGASIEGCGVEPDLVADPRGALAVAEAVAAELADAP